MNFICIMLFYNTITMGGIFSDNNSMSDDETLATLINWLTNTEKFVSTQSNGNNKSVELIRIDRHHTQKHNNINDFSKVI